MSLHIKNSRIHGFTLVELSIVIVIIGLIVAGVTAGSSLVRSSQIRSVISDIESYKTAVNAFKMQYNALPGDISNAQSYWTTATGNGNGNGMMEWENELVYLWQHLSLARLVPGTYSGVVAYNPGVTYPKASIKNTGFYITSVFGGGIQAYGWPNTEKTMKTIVFGTVTAANNGQPYTAALTATEAFTIDTKFDDGKPYSGRAKIRADGGTTCAVGVYSGGHPNAAQVAANQFNIGVSGILCAPIFSF